MAIYGSDVTAEVCPEDVHIVTEAIKSAFLSNGRTSAKYRIRHKNGSYVWVQMFGRLSHNGDGVYFLNTYYADLSEQEKREISFRETMPVLLRAIMQSSTDLSFAKDKDFRYICCSPAFAAFAGQTDESGVIGKTDFELFPLQTAEQFRLDDMNLFESGKMIVDKVEPIPSDDGIQHYSSTSKYILFDTMGGIVGLYGIGRDITEYRTSYSQLKLLTDSIPGGIATYVCTPEGIHLSYFNDGFCKLHELTGIESDAIISLPPLDGGPAADIKVMLDGLDKLKSGEIPSLNIVYRVNKYSSAGTKWINLRGVLSDRQGDVYIVNTVQFDITDAKLAEEEMRRTQEKLRLITQLVDDSSSAVYVCDNKHYEILYANRRCAEMCGKSTADIGGQPCYKFLKGLDSPCSPCFMDTSVYDRYTVREYTSGTSGKHYMTRGKLLNWGGKPAFVEYLSDETESIDDRLKLHALYRGMEMASRNSGVSFWQYDIDKKQLSNGSTNHMGYPDVYETNYKKSIGKE